MRRLASVAMIGFVTACGSPPPENLGVEDGQLASCSTAGSCVNTGRRQPEGTKAIYVLAELHRWEIIPELLPFLVEKPRMKVVTAEDVYLRLERNGVIPGIVDDIEVYVRLDREVMVRAARRGGLPDLGANQRLVEEIRAFLAERTRSR